MISNSIIVNLGGQERPLKFGMMAMQILSDISSKHGAGSLVDALVYAGLKNAYYAKQLEEDFTFEDVTDWVAEIMINGDKSGVLAKINTAFSQSKEGSFLIEAANQVKKKKSVGRKSTPTPLAK